MTGDVSLAWQPLRRYADFRGRSRRTELVLFYGLIMIAHVLIRVAISLTGVDARHEAELGLWAILALPAAALCVRRVHDSGFSGWWLLPLVPLFGWNAHEQVERIRNPYNLAPDLPLPVLLVEAVYFLAVIVLLLWDDEIGANRYGPNPRDSGSEDRAKAPLS